MMTAKLSILLVACASSSISIVDATTEPALTDDSVLESHVKFVGAILRPYTRRNANNDDGHKPFLEALL